MDGNLEPRRAGFMPEKISRHHQERLAIIYIRQSTPQQVERNQESTKLQYALVDRAFQFGWTRETIVTIDDDLGRSGSTIEGRLGFQRLVAEVGLGHVGLVLGIEMSRLARSCRDWHQLLEICALFDTLIADVEGVYDPANYNDRLLLGLTWGNCSQALYPSTAVVANEGSRHSGNASGSACPGEAGRGCAAGASADAMLCSPRLCFSHFCVLQTCSPISHPSRDPRSEPIA
jgi:hypothetical protein